MKLDCLLLNFDIIVIELLYNVVCKFIFINIIFVGVIFLFLLKLKIKIINVVVILFSIFINGSI